MKNELRGSEKLAQSCSANLALTTEELDQVTGGASGASIYQFSRDYFPLGTINPLLQAIKLNSFPGDQFDPGQVGGLLGGMHKY